jgi:hypothetical protein
MMRAALGVMAWIAGGGAAALAAISDADAVRGLRQALSDGSVAAVAKLGVENGYFGNPKVRIPLPPSLQRIEGRDEAAGR